MRRSAAMRTCSPIWCAACWRTAPIPRSSTASSMRRRRSRKSSPIRWRGHARLPVKPHPRIPAPRDIYGPERKAARGIDLADPDGLERLAREMEQALARRWIAGPIVGGTLRSSSAKPVTDPADRRRVVGEVSEADADAVEQALDRALLARRTNGTAGRRGTGSRPAACRGSL